MARDATTLDNRCDKSERGPSYGGRQVAVKPHRDTALEAEFVSFKNDLSKALGECANLYCLLNNNTAEIRRTNDDAEDVL